MYKIWWETNLNDILSSEIPGFENFNWNDATKDLNGNYVIEDFDNSITGNQPMNLNSNTYTILNINSNYIKDIEFTFYDFGASSEKFTIKDKEIVIGEIIGDSYSGNEKVNKSLDNSYVGSWDYSNLEVLGGLGTVKLNDIKKDVSIFSNNG